MDGRRARVLGPVLDRIPALERIDRGDAVERTAAKASRASDQLAPGWAAALGIGWPLAYIVAVAIEPAPTHPEAAPAVLATVASLALMVALWSTVFAAAHRQPSAALGGAITGAIAVAMTVTCPASGHHTLGAWWFGQLALTAGMLAVSLAALGPWSRARTAR
jgi:hypothetical protein